MRASARPRRPTPAARPSAADFLLKAIATATIIHELALQILDLEGDVQPAVRVDVLKALYGDQSAELNIFAISSEANARRLAQTLGRPARPSLAECLTIGEMAVYLAVSNDSAIRDVIVVQALNEIDELLVPLIAEYQAALQRFEEAVETIPDSADFSRRIAELLALDRAGHNSRWAYWHTSPPWAPPQR